MSIRAALHAISAALAAIAGGSVAFVGLPPEVKQDIAALASLLIIIIETYLASTTTGQSVVNSRK